MPDAYEIKLNRDRRAARERVQPRPSHEPLTEQEVIEHLRATVAYDHATGLLTRKRTGQPITTKTRDGYIAFKLNMGRRGEIGIRGHRAAWMITYGRWPGVIDHINRIRDDNRMCNLREVTRSENSRNTEYHAELLREEAGYYD
jgi:hypothetical protein